MEELVIAGERTKVIIHDVIIYRNSLEQDKAKVLSKNGNEWVLTENIIWYDNNSQTMRKNKLEKILN